MGGRELPGRPHPQEQARRRRRDWPRNIARRARTRSGSRTNRICSSSTCRRQTCPRSKPNSTRTAWFTNPSNFRKGCVSLHRHRVLQPRRGRNEEPHDRTGRSTRSRPAAGTRTKSASIFPAARRAAASIRSRTSASAARARKSTARWSMPTTPSSAGGSAKTAGSTNCSKARSSPRTCIFSSTSCLRVFDAKKTDGETFAEFCDRVPKAEILEALA